MSHLSSSSSSCAAPSSDGWARVADGVVLLALLALALRRCQARHGHRRSAQSPRAPRAVQTWESEGGRPTPPDQDVSKPGAAAAATAAGAARAVGG